MQTSIKQQIKDYLFKLSLARPINGYPLHRNEAITPFFIIGSGRCGTTLLRRVLTAHPDICIPPETYVLHKCIQLFRRLNTLPWDDLVNLVLSTIEYHPKFTDFNLSLRPLYQQLINIPEKDRTLALIIDQFYQFYASENQYQCIRWGDKTPLYTLHLDSILQVFPRAQFIHLIRNGVDVVHSYLKTKLRLELEDTSRRWLESVNIARSFGDQHPSIYLEIRYETFVEDPKKIVKQVCEFLGIEYSDRMIDSQAVANKMGDVPNYDHFSSVFNPISTENIGKGKQAFTADQLEEIRRIIGKDLAELGYPLK